MNAERSKIRHTAERCDEKSNRADTPQAVVWINPPVWIKPATLIHTAGLIHTHAVRCLLLPGYTQR